MKTFLFVLLCFLPIFTYAAGPQWPVNDAPKYWILDSGTYQLTLASDFTSSSSNFDSNGTEVTPATLSSISHIHPRINAGYALFPKLSIFSQIAFSSVSTDTAATGSSLDTDPSGSGLGDAFFAARYLIYSQREPGKYFSSARRISTGNFRVIAEASALVPLYEDEAQANGTSTLSTTALLGNHTTDLSLQLKASFHPSTNYYLSAGGGYTLRNNDYSAEYPFFVRADIFPMSETDLKFWIDWKATISAEGDILASTATRSDALVGGSLLFKAINPTEHKVGAGLAYRMQQNWELAAAYHKTVSGSNTAIANTISLGIVYRPTVEDNYEEEENDAYYEDDSENAVIRYKHSTSITMISKGRRFFKVGRGAIDGIQIEDTFHIYTPANTGQEQQFIASASIVAVRPNTAFLKLDPEYANVDVRLGYEARSVMRQSDSP